MRHQFAAFIFRLVCNAFGLWVAVSLLGTGHGGGALTHDIGTFLFAGLVFSIINAILKPIIVILSLPAILLTLGLFTIVVNGFMVYISLLLVPGLHMTFLHAILAGLVMSLVNYIVSSLLEIEASKHGE